MADRNAMEAVKAVRSKYPGAYDKYSDSELIGAIQRKYPGKYDDLVINESIPNTENVLQRASKAINTTGSILGGGFNRAVNAGPSSFNSITGGPATEFGHGVKTEAMTQAGMPEIASEAISTATDPQSLIMGMGVTRGAGRFIKNVSNPSKGYGEALSKSTGKVNFLDIISKHENDPVVQQVLKKAKVIKKYGGSNMDEGGAMSEKLANLSAKDSQNLINDVKLGKDALVSGKRIRPNEIGLAEFFSDLSNAQSKALPEMVGAKKLYGVSKNVGKFAKSTLGKALTTGAGTVAGGGAVYGLGKAIFGRDR